MPLPCREAQGPGHERPGANSSPASDLERANLSTRRASASTAARRAPRAPDPRVVVFRSKLCQPFPLRHQAPRHKARNGQAYGHGLQLGMRGSKTNLLGAGKLRLSAERRQEIDQLLDAARYGNRKAHLAIGRAEGPWTTQFHLPHLERRHLLLGHAFYDLQQLRLRLLSGIAGDQTFLALRQLERNLPQPSLLAGKRGGLPAQHRETLLGAIDAVHRGADL